MSDFNNSKFNISRNILKVYGIDLDVNNDSIRKSNKGKIGLVRKQIQVKNKNGTVFYVTRWVHPETEQSIIPDHPKYKPLLEHENLSIEEKIQHIVDTQVISTFDKIRQLVTNGIYDKKQLIQLSGHKYPGPVNDLLKRDIGLDIKPFTISEVNNRQSSLLLPIANGEDSLQNDINQVEAISSVAAKYGNKEAFKAQRALKDQVQKELGLTVDDKWESYECDLDMLFDGTLGLRAVMGYGIGGVGKTFTLESKILPERKMIEFQPEANMIPNSNQYDYVKIGGKIGSRETQRLLYEHRDKIIIFDDCDSMWDDKGLINVLKNALDTAGVGRTQWAMTLPETEKDKGDIVPSTFIFAGRVVFITNLTKEELVSKGAAAIVESRCASTDLTMSLEQTLERLDKIAPSLVLKDQHRKVMVDVTDDDKHNAFRAFKEMAHLGRIDQVNTRVLTQIIAKARYARVKLNLQGEVMVDFLKKQVAKQFGY